MWGGGGGGGQYGEQYDMLYHILSFFFEIMHK